MRTLEQKRAADALKRVDEVARALTSDALKREYRAYVDRLGPAIVMNGLGQALASERARGADGSKGNAHHELYKSLAGWLCRTDGVYPGSDLLEAITEHCESRYLLAQAEALAWLEWHKKFCTARFPKGESE